jgi:hypothetical protein
VRPRPNKATIAALDAGGGRTARSKTGKILETAKPHEFERQMAVARRIIKERRNALRELAKR